MSIRYITYKYLLPVTNFLLKFQSPYFYQTHERIQTYKHPTGNHLEDIVCFQKHIFFNMFYYLFVARVLCPWKPSDPLELELQAVLSHIGC